MIIQIIIGVVLAIAIYSIEFVRGAHKASEKKHEGIHRTQKTQRHKLGRYVGRNNGDIQNKGYIMKQEDKERIDQLLSNCNNILKENEVMKKGIDFLINEYHTNKRYFRVEHGKVTIEDVIKTCFEFGWTSRQNFN